MNKYKRIRLNRKETRDEHRIVMEKALGRKLNTKEFVHHIDGNKANNNINNLKVMNIKDHARLHINIPLEKRKLTGIKLRLPYDDLHLTCCKCHKFKLKEEFSKNKSNWNGFYHYCKTCDRVRQKNKREKNNNLLLL
jgi:hypothetical protein